MKPARHDGGSGTKDNGSGESQNYGGFGQEGLEGLVGLKVRGSYQGDNGSRFANGANTITACLIFLGESLRCRVHRYVSLHF